MRNVILCFAPWATLISTKVLLTCPSFTNRLLRLPARGVPSFCQDRYPHFFLFTIYWTILWHFEPGDTEIVRFPWIQMTKNNYKWHLLIPSYDKWPINLINRFNRLHFQEWPSWSLTWFAFSSPAFPFSSLSSLLDNGPARDLSSFLEGNEKMSTLMVMRKMVMMMLGCPKGVQKDFGF